MHDDLACFKSRSTTTETDIMAITLKPIKSEKITLRIRSLSPLIQHKWSDKALKMIRDKHAGKKTKVREVRDPEAEAIAATYFTDDGDFGLPAMAIKSALITAAHKDIGIEKTLLRKSLFLHCSDSNNVLTLETDGPIMREDCVRVGAGSADLRYRPEFKQWAVEVTFTFDAELLRVEDIINLVNRAGFGCGVGEWRPEKGGEYGRFEVDPAFAVTSMARAA
jgi:hypothetical protein